MHIPFCPRAHSDTLRIVFRAAAAAVLLVGGISQFCVGQQAAPAEQPRGTRATNEKAVGDLGSFDVIPGSYRASFDLRHVAFAVKRQGKQLVVVDGKEGALFKEISKIEFSPDGGHLAYAVELDDGKRTIVIDGSPGKSFEKIESWGFSPTGCHLAYRGKTGKQHTVFVDGREFGPYDLATPVVFSHDGSRYAFGVADAKGYPLYAIIDGKQVGRALPLTITATLLPRPNLTVDGNSVFGPDGKHTIYIEGEYAKWNLIVDGARPMSEPCTGDDFNVTFSPDGSRMAYLCSQKQGKDYVRTVYIDGQAQGSYQAFVGDMHFSPDGKRFAFVTRSGSFRVKSAVVVDGKEFTTPAVYTIPIFSPDGAHFAYSTVGRVVVDGIEQEIVNENRRRMERIFMITFSPDGKRIAYTTADNARVFWDVAVIDHKMDKSYTVDAPAFGFLFSLGQRVSAVSFSPDGRHTAYLAEQGKGNKYEVIPVIDRVEGAHYHDFVRARALPSPLITGAIAEGLVWDSPTQLRYLVIKDQKILEVTETFGPDR